MFTRGLCSRLLATAPTSSVSGVANHGSQLAFCFCVCVCFHRKYSDFTSVSGGDERTGRTGRRGSRRTRPESKCLNEPLLKPLSYFFLILSTLFLYSVPILIPPSHGAQSWLAHLHEPRVMKTSRHNSDMKSRRQTSTAFSNKSKKVNIVFFFCLREVTLINLDDEHCGGHLRYLSELQGL